MHCWCWLSICMHVHGSIHKVGANVWRCPCNVRMRSSNTHGRWNYLLKICTQYINIVVPCQNRSCFSCLSSKSLRFNTHFSFYQHSEDSWLCFLCKTQFEQTFLKLIGDIVSHFWYVKKVPQFSEWTHIYDLIFSFIFVWLLNLMLFLIF